MTSEETDDFLTKEQAIVLKAVASCSWGFRFTSEKSVKEELANGKVAFVGNLDSVLNNLQNKGFVERRLIYGENYVGLTDEGESYDKLVFG